MSAKEFKTEKYKKIYAESVECIEKLHDLNSREFESLRSISKYLVEKHPGFKPSATYKYIKKLNRFLIKNNQIVTELRKISEQTGAEIKDINAWVKVRVDKDKSVSVFLKGKDIDIAKNIDNCVDRFKDICKDMPKWRNVNYRTKSKEVALKGTFTDAHIGMKLEALTGLYKYDYDGDIFRKHIFDSFIPSLIAKKDIYGKFEDVIITDLGDAADGLNGYTTRGGHKLDQNMTDVDVFETIVRTKIEIVETLFNYDVGDRIIFQSVNNDNHAGVFAQLINKAVELYFNNRDRVKIDNLNAFIEPRIYGNHCFLLTHGKDKIHMKRGLPLDLNKDVENTISKFIQHRGLEKYYCHLEKGDLHQLSYNKCLNFDYRNFMSFAPPSNWIQHLPSVGDCYSGYSVQVINKWENEITHNDYFLNYKVSNKINHNEFKI